MRHTGAFKTSRRPASAYNFLASREGWKYRLKCEPSKTIFPQIAQPAFASLARKQSSLETIVPHHSFQKWHLRKHDIIQEDRVTEKYEGKTIQP